MNLEYIVISMVAYFIAFICGSIMVKRAVMNTNYFTDIPLILFAISTSSGWYYLIKSLGV
jgi:hypothetical protein